MYAEQSVPKEYLISGANGLSLGNTNLIGENVKITESLCNNEQLTFGSCETSKINFAFVNNGIASLIGKRITVTQRLNNENKVVNIGVYDVTEDKLSADRKSRNITAVDAMYSILNANVFEWYNGLNFPLTVKAMRDSFMSYLGITQENVTLINDSFTVFKTIYDEQLSGATVIKAICEINGVFGHITRDNQFRYVSLPSSNTGEEYTNFGRDKYFSVDYATYTANNSGIGRLIIREEQNDVGVTVGTGSYDNAYVVQGNFLCFGHSIAELQTMGTNLYNKIKNIKYVPINSAVVRGNPCLEVGDYVTFTDGTNTVNTYILQRTLQGITALKDTFNAKGVENYKDGVNSLNSRIEQLRGRSAKIKADIDGLSAIVSEIDENYATTTQLQITSDSLMAQIDQLQSEIDGSVYIYYTDTTPTLLNYPAWDFTYNIPCNDTVKLSNTLKFLYTDEYYRRNLRTLVYDEVAEKSYRFLYQNNVYGWVEVEEGDIGALIQRVTRLEMSLDGIATEVSTIQTTFATKEELSSSITQTAEEITSAVSATYQTIESATESQAGLQGQIDTNTGEINGIKRDYATTASMNSAISQSASNITSSVSANYVTKTSASSTYETKANAKTTKDSLQGQITTVDGKVDTIKSDYITTSKLNSAISQSATDITSTVSATYETKADADTTESNLQGQINTANTNISNIKKNYATTTAMNSAISQSASGIEASVSATYETKTASNTKYNNVTGELALKVAKTDNDQVVSMINASADVISLKGNRFEVESDNFKLSKGGNVSATGTFKSVTGSDGDYFELYKNGIVGMIGSEEVVAIARSVIASAGTQGAWYRGKDYHWFSLGGTNAGKLIVYPDYVYVPTKLVSNGSISGTDASFNNVSTYGLNVQNSGTPAVISSQARFLGWTDIETFLRFGVSNDNNKVWVSGGNGGLWIGNSDHTNSLNITGNLFVYGTKNRVVDTENYGKRAMNAYETAYAQFGDNGSGTCDENGLCEIEFEPIFAETIDLSKPYQVFLTQTSEKFTKWVEKREDRFIVHGEPGATFDYMIVARQKGYADIRLESVDIPTIND